MTTDADLFDLNASARLLNDRAGVLFAHGQDEANDVLNQRDEVLRLAVTAVMETGTPGAHPSQHDPLCALAWMRHDPLVPLGDWRTWGCDALPGCGCPEIAGGGLQ